MPDTIYLDYNATTPVCKEAVDAAVTAMKEAWGNPSSGHRQGRLARAFLEEARSQVSKLINAKPDEIVFTSGGTESNNLAILGAAQAYGKKRSHAVTSAIEHPSVAKVFDALEERGWRVTRIMPDRKGVIQPEAFISALEPDTVLASIMLANNETGVIQPISDMAAEARSRGMVFHTDASQAVGKIEVNAEGLGVDLLTIAGHKLYAPKGTGALFVRAGTRIAPIMYGAGQEGGLRPGTEPVPQAAALGAACRAAGCALSSGEPNRISALRDGLFSLLEQGCPEVIWHGRGTKLLPNTLYVSFPGLSAPEILERAPEVLASTGAACHDRGSSISSVLAAMGVSRQEAMGTIRFSLGRPTTEEEIERAAALLLDAARALGAGA